MTELYTMVEVSVKKVIPSYMIIRYHKAICTGMLYLLQDFPGLLLLTTAGFHEISSLSACTFDARILHYFALQLIC